MPTDTSDRTGTADDAYVDFEVWGDDAWGPAVPLYVTRTDRPSSVSVRFTDEATLAVIPFILAEVDDETSMIRLGVAVHVALNAPRMPEGADPEQESVRNVLRHFDPANRIETAGPPDTTPTA